MCSRAPFTYTHNNPIGPFGRTELFAALIRTRYYKLSSNEYGNAQPISRMYTHYRR